MADAILSASGIYVIRNTINGKLYVGSAVNFKARFARHKACLNGGTHHSRKLQSSWIKWQESAFDFEILEACELNRLIEREQFWIDILHAFGPMGYNMIPKAGSHIGAIRTPEIKAKMSEAQRGRVQSPETRQRIREANYLKPRPSLETRAKLSKANRGAKRSPEAVENMRRAQQSFVLSGKTKAPISEQTREKIKTTSTGRKHSKESIEKMAAAKRGKKRGPLSQEWRENIAKGSAGRVWNDESKKKLSIAIKASPAFAAAKKALQEKSMKRISVGGVEYSSMTEATKALGYCNVKLRKMIAEGEAHLA